MTLGDWCEYDAYYCTQEGGCNNCKLNNACKCPLHCNHEIFSRLRDLPSIEDVDAEMQRMLSYRKGPPRLRGLYFWSLSCDGRGSYPRIKNEEDL